VSAVQVQSVSFSVQRYALPTPNRNSVLLPLSGGSSFIAARAAFARVIAGWMLEHSTKSGITRLAFLRLDRTAGSAINKAPNRSFQQMCSVSRALINRVTRAGLSGPKEASVFGPRQLRPIHESIADIAIVNRKFISSSDSIHRANLPDVVGVFLDCAVTRKPPAGCCVQNTHAIPVIQIFVCFVDVLMNINVAA
jgi:hypothetical protein